MGLYANPENLFDYKRYVAGKQYSDDGLCRIYLEVLHPHFKLPLIPTFVSNEDDLGPEIILNLKWLDVYRYQ